jgi:hypothetical protein
LAPHSELRNDGAQPSASRGSIMTSLRQRMLEDIGDQHMAHKPQIAGPPQRSCWASVGLLAIAPNLTKGGLRPAEGLGALNRQAPIGACVPVRMPQAKKTARKSRFS